MKIKKLSDFSQLTILFLFISFNCFPQQNSNEATILFYNVENLFDIEDDPLTNDDEFTPEGDRHWTYNRMNQKLLNISKVILSSSGWTPPVVIALCEVENHSLLERLIGKTPLKSVPYKIIHKESPDHRGIEVALLYNTDQFYPLKFKYFPLRNKNDSIIETREILYVSGILNKRDTLHLFVNHWPSRYSGLLETRLLRNRAAKLLRLKIDELLKKSPSPKIVIMGDFNDQPNDESISGILKAEKIPENINTEHLYNLSANWLNKGLGTLKYQLQWSVFDQIIVSGSLLNTKKVNTIFAQEAIIVNMPFLLEKDERYGGLKPKRTYVGFSYNGGFSDHLPVLLKLKNVGK